MSFLSSVFLCFVVHRFQPLHGNAQLTADFRHFAGHLTCSNTFRGYKRPRKLKTANIKPYVFMAKTRKFGDAKIFHFTVVYVCPFIVIELDHSHSLYIFSNDTYQVNPVTIWAASFWIFWSVCKPCSEYPSHTTDAYTTNGNR